MVKTKKSFYEFLVFVSIVNPLSCFNLSKISNNKKFKIFGIILFIIQLFLFIFSLRLFILPEFLNSLLTNIYRIFNVINFDLQQITLISFWLEIIIYIAVIIFYFVEKNKISRGKCNEVKSIILSNNFESKDSKNNHNEINFERVQIDINSATEEELAGIPLFTIIDIKRVIEYRNKNGGFNSKSEFYDVINAKPHIVAKLDNVITIGEIMNTPIKNNNKKRKIDI